MKKQNKHILESLALFIAIISVITLSFFILGKTKGR